MVKTSSRLVPKPLHWSFWLAAGVISFSLVVGFAAGLARPHARR